MVCVGAESSNSDLMVTAFTRANSARTFVALNRSLKKQRVMITLPGADFQFAELTGPCHQNSLVENPIAQNGRIEIVMLPGSIATLSMVPLKKLPADFTIPA